MEIQEEITLKDLIQSIQGYWNYLISKWKIIAIVVFIGAILGVSASFIIKTKYAGKLTFVIDEKSKVGGLAGLASTFGLGGVAGDQSLFSSSNIIEFLKTRSMVEESLLRPIRDNAYHNRTYADFYIKENKLDKNWHEDSVLKKIQFKVGEDRSTFAREKDSILGAIYNRILEEELAVLQPNKDNSFIQVSMTSTNEMFSKNFPIELVDVVSEYYSKSKTQKAKNTVNVLQVQVDSVKRALYTSMGGAANSSDQVFGLNPSMNAQRVTSAKEQTQVQMNIAILQELVKNLEVAKMDLLNNTPIITIVENPIYPLEKKRVTKLKGIIIGGFLAGFLAVAFLIAEKYWKYLISEEN